MVAIDWAYCKGFWRLSRFRQRVYAWCPGFRNRIEGLQPANDWGSGQRVWFSEPRFSIGVIGATTFAAVYIEDDIKPVDNTGRSLSACENDA